MQNPNANPLLCNIEAGLCELPSAPTNSAYEPEGSRRHKVKITYFTDPICSTCWGVEPQLRKLKLEYGDQFDLEYKMGGLLPDWSYNSGGISKPSDVAPHWDEVSAYYGMPIDGDVWLEDPLSSSFPPSIAFKAAELQSPEKAIAFLRRMREMVFLEKKNITRWEYISEAATESGLNAAQLKTDFERDGQKAFEADLAIALSYGVRGFPTFFFSYGQEAPIKVYGFKPYEVFEQALLTLLPSATKQPINSDHRALFTHYPTLTTKEYATLTSLDFDRAERQLKHLYTENVVSKTTIKNGTLWTLIP